MHFLKLSNENKQRLYKIQKRPTSLSYHVLLIQHNEVLEGACNNELLRVKNNSIAASLK